MEHSRKTEAGGAQRDPGRPSALSWLFGLGFLLMLGVPGVLAATGGQARVERAAKISRRRPSPLPSLPRSTAEVTEASAAFDDWFADAWGGRERALRLNASASMRWFGTSPSDFLFFGSRGWVFSKASRSMESFTGTDPLSEAELIAWKKALEDRRAWLARQGIDHVVAFVPHKSSVYPEELPASIASARGTSRLEQFQAWFEERSSVNLLDLAPALIAAKTRDSAMSHVYSPHGIHWTGVGAHAAYEVIADYLSREHGAPPPLPLEAFDVLDQRGEGDSWAGRMMLDGVIHMENLTLEPKAASGLTESRSPKGGDKDVRFEHPDASRPRIVMAHDSFGPDIRHLIAGSTSILDCRWRAWLEAEVVERVQPDVVIELYSELSLVTTLPHRRSTFLAPAAVEAIEAGRVLQAVDAGSPGAFGEGAPLRFASPQKRTQLDADAGAATITLVKGVTILEVAPPSADALAGLAGGEELFMRLSISAKTAGVVGVYRGPPVDGTPPLREMLPLSISPGAGSAWAILPVLRSAATFPTQIFLPPHLQTVTLRQVEVRAVR